MSILARRLTPRLVQALTNPRTRRLQRWLAEQRRRLHREPHRVLYFHRTETGGGP